MSKVCNFDPTFQCIIQDECPYPELLSCLKINYSELKHRQMKRHDTASLKWRNSAFYYKARCKKLQSYIQLTKLTKGGGDVCGNV